MKLTSILFVFCGLSLTVSSVKAQAELEFFENLQNRITINQDNGAKEVFTVTPKVIKAKSNALYYWYQSQKIQQTQGGYTGKLLDGQYTFFYPSKQLAKQGSYKRGLAHGQWKAWNNNNRLSKEETWKKGHQNGEASYYDEQGHLLSRGQMKEGTWNGKVWTFSPADTTYQWAYYKAGKPISKESYINASVFRRSGRFFGNLWNRTFHRKKETDVVIPE
ncbi:toxin-antitoxin system YwqK family antitoxin [Sphingobacterium sp. LRF_L2]|uniref:toxin-antitoxin system YwqK family antitoxin n=1 Tax=Sphingobacterium sp. LRF_L2 TaxID=3369421 RepID=UPI003F641E19